MKKSACVVFLLLATSVAATAKKFPVTAAAIVPATQGKVETGTDKNGNTKIKLKVEHLASPDRLSPPQNNYVLWLQERGGAAAENRGKLVMNKKLEGEFEAITPLKNFDLFVTGEVDATAKAPSGPEILRATIQP